MRAHHVHWNPTGSRLEPDLFEILPPAQPVDTSREAAAKITGRTARLREAIYLYLHALGFQGATALEIEAALGIKGSTIRPRLRELQGTAPWAKGKLKVRIMRTLDKRAGARVYRVLR